jgi:hypothetical protein
MAGKEVVRIHENIFNKALGVATLVQFFSITRESYQGLLLAVQALYSMLLLVLSESLLAVPVLY